MRCEKRLRALLSIIVAYFHENRVIFSARNPRRGLFCRITSPPAACRARLP
jgi:hypothetical protein